MGIAYQLTFFLALTLLAIVITVFVFAVSLLGRAVEAAAESESDKLAERKEDNAKQMAAIKKEIEESEASGQIPKGLIHRLKKLEKRDEKFEKELSKIKRAPELLTVRGAVVHPGISLGIALVFTGLAWYLSSLAIPTVPVIIWILGLAAIGYSISRIYKSLRVVESVAITSEEAALIREKEALKMAFREHEEAKKPKLELMFEGKEFPLHVKADSEVKLTLMIHMLKGDSAEDVSVHFAIPPSFDFPHEKDTTTLAPDSGYPDYVDVLWQKEKVIRGLVYRRRLTIKTPPTADRFNFVYWIFCKGFRTEPTELEIIVE